MLDIIQIPTTMYAQNTRILIDQDNPIAVVVDPGAADAVIATIEDYGYELKAILLTHGHLDHVAGTADLLKRFPEAKVYGPHEGDAFLVEHLKEQQSWVPVEFSDSFKCEYLKDGDVIDVFPETPLQVMHTPGHTPGHVCFYSKEENFVLVGDVLFKGSIGRTDFEGGNFEELEKSIKTRLYTLPDITEVFSGHGEDTSIGEEKKNNAFVRA